MDKVSGIEIDVLRFIRRERHKTRIVDIARGLNLPPSQIEAIVRALLSRDLLKVVPGKTADEDGYYTNPEMREKIYELIG